MRLNILTVLQYTAAGLLTVTGFCNNNMSLGFAGLIENGFIFGVEYTFYKINSSDKNK
jgi:hypothetical protein